MDILMDMARKERLQNGRGNAILVSDSIYNACRYFEKWFSSKNEPADSKCLYNNEKLLEYKFYRTKIYK